MKSFEELVHDSGIPVVELAELLERDEDNAPTDEEIKPVVYNTCVGLLRFVYLLANELDSSMGSLYTMIDTVDDSVRGREIR